MARRTNSRRKVDPVTEAIPPKVGSKVRPGSIVDTILRLRAQIPDEEWKKLPRDGSYNLDHYLYGAPQKKP